MKDPEKYLFQRVSAVPWGHNIMIMTKLKNIRSRLFYLEAARKGGWTRDTLLQQIKSDAFSRSQTAKRQHNCKSILPAHLYGQAAELVKNNYMLGFLGAVDPVKERELEKRLLKELKKDDTQL